MSATDVVRPRFALMPADQPAAELELALLARWRDEKLFESTLAERDGAPPFVFYEGPPTANGRPGIHHVFARTIKDLFCRHRAMKGYRVERKAGWDTHGLPVEIEVEKRLNLSGKQDIEKLGVAEFNRLCRESVFTYRAEWELLSERIGYWLDYENPYVTYTPDYIESVWWSLATLHAKGLLSRGHKILPYCPRCGTTLSSHEVAQGYEDVQDPSVYIALDLGQVGGEVVEDAPDMPGRTSRRVLVWTTTPWTLVSNAALAVHPELMYVELQKTGSPDTRTIIMAESRAKAVLGDDYILRWTWVRTMNGSELVGARYRRPIDWLPYPEGTNHEIVVGESFVSADDGSGVVHMSPAFGADDYAAGLRHNLAFLQPVNPRGEFPEDMPLVGGQFVKKADTELIAELERRGVLWKAGTLTHSYPHCWRCSTPLLYYARSSWFVRTSSYKQEMLARNAQVNWNPPEVGSGRFGEWLENNIDWAVSRDRYWGTPLPLWVCDRDSDHVDAVGSFANL
ncbi:MAG: class I tRNA ligase family protein, partial [bacterium]